MSTHRVSSGYRKRAKATEDAIKRGQKAREVHLAHVQDLKIAPQIYSDPEAMEAIRYLAKYPLHVVLDWYSTMLKLSGVKK